MLRRRKKEQTFERGAKQKPPQYTPRSSIANLPEDLQRPVLMKSPTHSENSEGKVTNEELQATVMAVLRSMKKSSQNMERNSRKTREDISKLYSLTGNLQRRLDLEYSTPENDNATEMMSEPSPVEEPAVPFFPFT